MYCCPWSLYTNSLKYWTVDCFSHWLIKTAEVLKGDDPRGRAFAIFLHPHPRAFRQLMCPHPGEFAYFFKKCQCSTRGGDGHCWNWQTHHINYAAQDFLSLLHSKTGYQKLLIKPWNPFMLSTSVYMKDHTFDKLLSFNFEEVPFCFRLQNNPSQFWIFKLGSWVIMHLCVINPWPLP